MGGGAGLILQTQQVPNAPKGMMMRMRRKQFKKKSKVQEKDTEEEGMERFREAEGQDYLNGEIEGKSERGTREKRTRE